MPDLDPIKSMFNTVQEYLYEKYFTDHGSILNDMTPAEGEELARIQMASYYAQCLDPDIPMGKQ